MGGSRAGAREAPSLGVVPVESKPALDLHLSRSALDRAAARRSDPATITGALASPQTKVLDLYADRAACEGPRGARRLRYRAPATGDADAVVLFLGEAQGSAYLAVIHGAEDDGDDQRSTLRSLAMELDELDIGALTTATGLLNWHATHGFCPRCGAATEVRESGWTRVCTTDGSQHFPVIAPAVIMAVIDEADRLLLARGPEWGENRMSVLAGFVEPGESLEKAVEREVAEEVGIASTDVVYRGNQPWPFPAQIMLGFRARALSTDLTLQDGEIAEARWFTREQLREAVESGALGISPGVSIARHLIEDWYGGELKPPAEVTTLNRT